MCALALWQVDLAWSEFTGHCLLRLCLIPVHFVQDVEPHPTTSHRFSPLFCCSFSRGGTLDMFKVDLASPAGELAITKSVATCTSRRAWSSPPAACLLHWC